MLTEACAKWPPKVLLDFSGDTWTHAVTYGGGQTYRENAGRDRRRSGLRVDNHVDLVLAWFGTNTASHKLEIRRQGLRRRNHGQVVPIFLCESCKETPLLGHNRLGGKGNVNRLHEWKRD
jgi:hypothetical protein